MKACCHVGMGQNQPPGARRFWSMFPFSWVPVAWFGAEGFSAQASPSGSPKASTQAARTERQQLELLVCPLAQVFVHPQYEFEKKGGWGGGRLGGGWIL